MARKILIGLLVFFLVLLAAAVGFVVYMETRPAEIAPVTTVPVTEAPATEITETTEAPATEAPTTVPPTTEALPTETEPQEIRYTLTFTGDCTLGSDPSDFASQHSFIGTIGEDYGFPFRNVLEYFENDDLTLINLESVLVDSNQGNTYKRFNFRGPTAYTQIMTSSSVEGVTLANNHSEDFGIEGYENTRRLLEENNIVYVEKEKTTIFTTEGGLTIGLYADVFDFSESEIRENIAALREQGAELVICAFHWGTEGAYRHNDKQERAGHAAIDAGADIVWGHHPHVLQEIEEYNGGLIYYSLGNFSFGGNDHPKDPDSAVIQQQIIREHDGTVRLGEMTIIPICISSVADRNNYQPTPYEAGSESYQRVLEKLNGTYSGPNVIPHYW